jgi:hypothetical protein
MSDPTCLDLTNMSDSSLLGSSNNDRLKRLGSGLDLTAMLDPRALDLATIPNLSLLRLTVMPDPRALGLALLLDPKQTTSKQKTIVHFSC